MRTMSWMLPLALLACDAPDAADAVDAEVPASWSAEAPVGADVSDPALLPPPLPVVMTLSTTPWLPGGTATLTAQGAIPGAKVFFIQGTGLGTSCPAPLGGDCLDITGVSLLGWDFADGAGVASLDEVVDPALLPGDLRFVQAVVAAGAPYSSDVAEVEIGAGAVVEDMTLSIEGAKIFRRDPAAGGDWDFDPLGFVHKPDAFWTVWVDGTYVASSNTDSDTLNPEWNGVADVTVPVGSTVYIDVWDDDSGLGGADDYIGTVTLTHDDLQALVGVGLVTHVGDWALRELDVDVTAQ